MECSHGQASPSQPPQKQKHLGARLKAAYDRNRGSKEQQQKQRHPALPLHSLGTLQPLLTAPPATRSTVGAAAAAAAAAAVNWSSDARQGQGGCSVSRRDARRRIPVAGLEMIERGLDESGSSTTSSSTTAATTSSSGSSSVRSGGAGATATSSWATRSKLPFHKLPFEVQQYHLAQRLHSISNGNSSRRPRSDAATPDAPPTEEEDESAVVESAWFPLMPPAMAGEARQSSQPLTASQQRRVTDGTGEVTTAVDRFETAADCAALIAPDEESGQQGSESRWASMEGIVVHLTAALGPRGTYFPSTTTVSTSSEASTSTISPVGSDGEEGGEQTRRRRRRELPPLWASSCSSSSSTVVTAATSFTRRAVAAAARSSSSAATTAAVAPATMASKSASSAAEAVTPGPPASATQPQQRQQPVSRTRLINFDNGTLDDSRDHTTKALTLAALSGFIQSGGASTFQQVSLTLSDACRALAPWSLRVGAAGDGTGQPRLPPQLADHLWPGSSQSARQRPAVTSFAGGSGRGGGGGGGGSRGAGSSRLKSRRFITRIEINGNNGSGGHGGGGGGGMMSVSWPASMKRLEFGARFNSPVEGVSLPDGVEVVKFGAGFNQPVSRIRWPPCLRELAFGNDFNQPVSGIGLPAGLRRLDFGGRFNFPISAVDLPKGLREIRFGHGFNREIASVRWPPRLSNLEFCGELQQRVEELALPETLTHLTLLGDFDQPIHAVEWPPGLTTVRFGDRFRQTVTAAAWPPSLRTLVVGPGYDMRLLRAGCGRGCSGGDGAAGSLSSTGAVASEARAPVAGDCCSQRGGTRREDTTGGPGLPATCEVLRACDDGGDGDFACAANEVGPENEEGQEEEGEAAGVLQAGGWQNPTTEDGAAEGGILVAGCGAFCPDGVSVGGCEQYSAWNDVDEEDGGGLECEDVFGFEDGTWDMGDPWDPGAYPSGCGNSGSGSGSSSTVGFSY